MAGFGFGAATTPFTTAPQTSTVPFGTLSNPAGTGTMTGFSFGAPTTTSSPFSFGSSSTTTAAPLFGAGLSTPSTFGSSGGLPFGGFSGTTATTVPASSGFSFGLGSTSTAPSTGFGFGTTVTTSTPSFAFGGSLATSTPGTSTFSGLGTGTAPLGSTGFTFGSLGGTTTTPAPGFSFTAPATGTGLSFGTLGTGGSAAVNPMGYTGALSTNPGLTFGTIPPSNASLGAIPNLGMTANTLAVIASALSLPNVYGDERDTILAKLNQLQAFWGTGKGYFSNNAPPAVFSQDNPFCKFKAIGYSMVPDGKAEDGLIGLVFAKKESEIRSYQQQLIDSLHRIFGSKPTLSIHVEGVKSLPEDRSEVVIYLVEQAPAGGPLWSKRIQSAELQAFLEQATVKAQLTSLGVTQILSKTAPSKDQLTQYLDNPPAGIDPLLWQQARLDNPEPEKLIPVPMIGFGELQRRLKCQEQETKQHQERLDIIAEDMAELQRKHATTMAKIAEHKRKQLELSHRVLKIMVAQEIQRKHGFAIQADEEQLRIQLESIQSELNAPTRFKGRLNELISQLRMQNNQVAVASESEKYALGPSMQEEMKQVLRQQQMGIMHLMSILKEDMEDLKTIELGLKESLDRRR